MKKITLWLFALFTCLQIHAQVNLYSFSSGTSGVLDPMIGSTQLIGSAIDDDASAVTNIGFSFTFAGTAYTQFSVNANGLLRFGSTAVTTAYTNSAANANSNTPAVMPYWDDLATGTDGKVHYLLTGSAPNRKLIIEWFVTVPRNTAGAANAKFQCVLEETTNAIQFVYGSGMLENTVNSGATIGLLTSTTLYHNVNASTHINTSSSFITTNTSAIASGRTYSWAPPVACSGTPIGGTAMPALQYTCASSTPGAISVSGSQGGMTGLTYQWEQSTDNGGTWGNVVGGTGATTLTYTPPVNTATPATVVQYRLKVSCSGNDGYSSVASVYAPVNPSGQVTATTLTGVTQTGFTINWTNGNGNRRAVYMSTSATFTNPTNTTGVAALTAAAYSVATGGQQLIYDGTATSTSVTGLLPGVQYYVRVVEYVRCGAGTSYDSYFNVTDGTNVANVTTTAPLALPWGEDFATTVTTTPVNWTNSTTWSFGTTTALNPAIATNYVYKALSTTTPAIFITPYIAAIPASYRLVFDYKIANSSSPYAAPAAGTGDFKVAVSTDNGVTYTDVATVANNAVAGWQNYILDLAAYQGQVVRIRITATRVSTSYTIGFDNFKIEPIPACEGPLLTSLVSSAVTDATATVSWTAPTTAPANGYDYYVSTTNTAPAANATPTGSVAAGVTSANLTGLTPSVIHYVWVRSKCSTTDISGWVGSINFKTDCSPISTFPFVETFNTDSTTKGCWKVNNGNADGDVWNLSGSTIPRTGLAAELYTDYNTSNNDYLITPKLDLGSTAKRLKFWVRHYSDLEPDNLKVKLSTAGYAIADFTNTLLTLSTTQITATYTEYVVDLSAYSGAVYLAFVREDSPADGWYLSIDDVTVELMPTCFEPALSTITASAITSTSADIGWTDPATVPAGYEYVVSTTNTAPTAAGTAVTTGYVQLTALTPDTMYYIFVRSVCSSTDASPWVGPKSFRTQCASISTFPYTEGFNASALPACYVVSEGSTGATYHWESVTADATHGAAASAEGSHFLRMNYYNASATYNPYYITTPTFTLPSAPHRAKFKIWMGATSGATNLVFQVSTDGGTTYTDLATYSQNTSNSTSTAPWSQEFVDLTTYASQSVKFRLKATSNFGSGFCNIGFDDFNIQPVPNCIEPATASLAASAITASGADIGWTDPSTVPAGYEYVYSTTNTAPTTAGTATASGYVQLTGLTANTTYYVFVRSACSTVDFSPWVGPLTFTTLCSPATTINENFDAVTTPALPSCWSKIVGGTGVSTYAAVTTTTTSASSPNGVSLYNSSSAATSNIMLVSPPIGNLAAGTHRLKFKGKNSLASEDVEIGVLTNPADASTFTVLQTVDLSTTFAEYIVNFASYTGAAQHIAFRRLSTSTYTYVYLDDVIWEAVPTTVPACATGIVATPNTNCGNNPTVITWPAVTGADGYYLTMGTTSGASNVLNNVNIGNVTTYSYVGNINQQYYFKLVPFNNVGSATGCTENIFTTVATGCYCEPTYTYGITSGDLISNIVISNTTLANNSGTDTTGSAYTFYTGQPSYTASLQAGSAYTVTVTVGSFGSQNVAAWIDYNDNYIFEANERIGYTTTSIASNGTASFTITLACNPPLGVHRMRVRDVYSTSGVNIDPCANYGFGETEDYNVTITTAAPCPVPSALTATAITTSGASLGWNIGCSETVWDVHVSAPNAGQPTSSTVLSNAAITTNPLVLTGLTANTAYEFYVRANCGGSNGESAWVGPFAFTTLANPPANDDCTNAVVLTPGVTFAANSVIGTNLAATATSGIPVPTCDSGYIGGDVWYSVVVPATGSITIETNSNTGSNISDTVMSVYSGACGSLTQIGCDDDSSSDGNFSMVTLTSANNIVAGQTLYVRVWEYGNNAFGTFKVSAYDAALSNDTFDTTNFTAYPNPVKDVLNLSYTSTISNVKVVNLLGQQVINKTTNDKEVQVNMSDLPTGAYIVNITVEDTVHTIKVIKQ